MPKKNKLNARRRCASISLSLLHTQGVKTLTNQKMQNEPNYPYRWHLAGFPIPNYAKQTLKITQAAGLPPLYLTPTEVGETPTTPKCAKRTQFRHAGDPFFAKRTQLPHTRCPTTPKKCQTNPICPAPTLPQTRKCKTNPISAYPASRRPLISAKRTQFPHTQRPAAPRLCETNPIYRTGTACRAPKMRNEPNLSPGGQNAND